MKSTSHPVVALDLGGTWIKGACRSAFAELQAFKMERMANPAPGCGSAQQFAIALYDFCLRLTGGATPASVCIATAGEVSPDGAGYLATAGHLGMMGTNEWQPSFRDLLGCPFWMLNDAEAFLLGAAEEHLFSPRENVAGLVVGTGLGFCVSKEGRWWKPFRRLPLFGSLRTPAGTYDELASAVQIQERTGFSLVQLFTEKVAASERAKYLDELATMAAGVCCLHHPDRILFGGGLADAASEAGFFLAEEVEKRLGRYLPRGVRTATMFSVPNANRLVLAAGLSIASENLHADAVRFRSGYEGLPTESPSPSKGIETASPLAMIQHLWEEEQYAGQAIHESLESIADVAMEIAEICKNGGRVIYVGAGTSGRIAAIDAVEMPCTYGVPRSQFVALIAGGGSDSAWDIESNHEEDAPSAPELLLMQPGPGDMVLGISVSGTAFFVRSALSCARRRGARTVLIHEAPVEEVFFDKSIRLHSGPEPVGGSTRMKGGTATKKVLNWLGTCAMILLGKTRDGWMIDFQPVNEKLMARAAHILTSIHGIPPREATKRLAAHGYCLRAALESVIERDNARLSPDKP